MDVAGKKLDCGMEIKFPVFNEIAVSNSIDSNARRGNACAMPDEKIWRCIVTGISE